MHHIKLFATLLCVITFGAILGGCSVNVIVAPDARMTITGDSPYQYLEASPTYHDVDCVTGQDGEGCQ